MRAPSFSRGVFGTSAVSLGLLSIACTPTAAAPPACPQNEAKPAPTASAAPSAPARFAVLPEDASPITFDRMAAFPEPGWNVPRHIGFSADKKSILYLASETGGPEMALFAYELEKKASRALLHAKDLLPTDKPLSREEELRRERMRQRTTGINDYQVAKDSGDILVPLGGDLYLRGKDGQSTQLTRTDEPEIDPQICKSGERVFFVRGSELYALDTRTKKETALTKGAKEGVTHGLTDFNGQEELDEESGYFPTRACDKVAYLEVDERKVGTTDVVGYRGKKPDKMEQRYPESGTTNPSVRIGIADVASKKTTWVTLPDNEERYFGRFQWAPDGSALYFVGMARDQKSLSLYRVDKKGGAATELAKQSAAAWVDLPTVQALEKSNTILWTTPKDGHIHLETRDGTTGKLVAEITKGRWDVAGVNAVDEEKGVVYFSANKESPIEQHLYKVPLTGGEPSKVTPERGVHGAFVSPQTGTLVDLHSAHDRPPQVTVRSLDGAEIGSLPVAADPQIEALKIRPRELISITGPSGDTLYGALLRPRETKPGDKHPVVVNVYGGPGVQIIHDSWAPSLFWQHLADRGFVVFQLDNRGSSGRGPAFEHPIKNQLGKVELQDQLAGVAYLKTLPFVDPDRIGIQGASYGGFMTALAMFKAPDVFKVGVVGAPVTEWQLYDTAYTERYMGQPKENAAGYDASDLTKMVDGLKGKLLLMHSLMDENVHFQNSADLIDALVTANKPFDLMIFPGERHGYRSPPARKYAFRKIAAYFADNL
ncbi:MAG: DPP IV N-terminal domain-containing protein [Polyangiaceae bacterium]